MQLGLTLEHVEQLRVLAYDQYWEACRRALTGDAQARVSPIIRQPKTGEAWCEHSRLVDRALKTNGRGKNGVLEPSGDFFERSWR